MNTKIIERYACPCYDKATYLPTDLSEIIVKIRHHFLVALIAFLSLVALFFSAEVKAAFLAHTQLDSIGHFVGFFCLSLLLNAIFKFPLLTTIACLTFYAALSEIGQYYLGFRNGEFRDVVADVSGILFFALLKWLYTLYCLYKPKAAQ